MSVRFREIDRQLTPMGEISVRRRLEPTLGIDVYEVKLGDEHLMSNLFTAAEIALADLALAQLDQPGGVFGLWSDTPDDELLATARTVFATCDAHEVRFPNHHTGGDAANTVYVARKTSD